ncbi:STAS/SEC14 domain-containing protein [Echinicola jeungdonensis]|uniref:STAS/SEC14 domain-containing protein n=1 Tax=Echinicola jeungdonensis TaxID=709343 RepID=A0ABV5J2Y0_9BACT|nr:STAS/SEC14 domain-containing protein [Echinicola jeungdonensis]MDN3670559.1 STAS/SEC14 domain-containing protein [Echinicola jeungdonensis]
MIEQFKVYDTNVLALEVKDGFKKVDEQLFEKLVKDKLNQGYEIVNVLVKLDEMEISKSSIKAFFEDAIWWLRNYNHVGHLAVVAHSNIVKALIPIDNLFFQRASKGRIERYFDISQLDEALEFVKAGKK